MNKLLNNVLVQIKKITIRFHFNFFSFIEGRILRNCDPREGDNSTNSSEKERGEKRQTVEGGEKLQLQTELTQSTLLSAYSTQMIRHLSLKFFMSVQLNFNPKKLRLGLARPCSLISYHPATLPEMNPGWGKRAPIHS